MAASSPRMTAQQAADPQPHSLPGTMRLQGLDKIPRATRLVTASAPRPAQRLQQRRHGPLIGADQKHKHSGHKEGGKIESRRQRSNHSARRSSIVAPAAVDFATITKCQPGGISTNECRTISRNRRRTLLRTTAPPTRRDVMIPTLDGLPSTNLKHPTRIKRACTDRPCSRTRANSLLL